MIDKCSVQWLQRVYMGVPIARVVYTGLNRSFSGAKKLTVSVKGWAGWSLLLVYLRS